MYILAEIVFCLYLEYKFEIFKKTPLLFCIHNIVTSGIIRNIGRPLWKTEVRLTTPVALCMFV